MASGSPVAGIHPAIAAVPGSPTAVVGTADGRWAFASVSLGHGGQIAVLAQDQGTLHMVRTVALPATMPNAFGLALTHDGRQLLVAGYTQTAVLNVGALEDGVGSAVAGVLVDSASGQFEVAVSQDDRYVFVSDETSGGLSVFDLATALRYGFFAPRVAVGVVPLASGAVGLAFSPDGTLLYVTTFGSYGPHGQLWVLDAAKAEAGAGSTAVVANAEAGCQPVRVAVAPDGGTVWVTALQSNALLGFSATALRNDPALALQVVVPVGSEPVGLVLADRGRIALVANSNRGLVSGTGGGTPQSLSIIDTASALAHRPALLGTVPAGLFPRDLSIDPVNSLVLLANFNSGTVEAFPEPTAG